MGLEKRVAVITGGSKGIGQAIALRLAREGADIVIADIDKDAMHSAADAIRVLGGKVMELTLDVASVDEIKDGVGKILREMGKIEILVNNAGIAPTTSIDKISEEEWRRVLDVNLNSVFFMSQAVIDPMKKQKWGRIINISSMAGRMGSIVAGCHYGASKAAILGITKNFARFLAMDGVTVNAIAPGPVMSDIIRSFSAEKVLMLKQNSPMGRIGTVENVAETVAFLCSDGADFMTGATIDVNGGMFMG
ncbi:MAG: SDR family NAD(P)-dependent oxidoreductase [Spirochaetota bacterium]